MQMIWKFGRLAVVAETIDFRDPAESGLEVRERGVRLELRLVSTGAEGSIYACPRWELDPAVCRIDLLESRPGAGNRMHWHPTMNDGEPGERTFDDDMRLHPAAWTAAQLRNVETLLRDQGITDFEVEAEELRSHVHVVEAWIEQGLAQMRRPWPSVTHDERGLASSS